MITLQTPFNISNLSLKNRVVMSPMTRSKSPGHVPGEDVARYYARRAQGDVGLIITEGTCIGHKAAHGYPDVPSFYGSKALEGWKHVIQSVHQAGGKIFPQLWHVGSIRQSDSHGNAGVDNPRHSCVTETKVPGYGPSKIVHPYITGGEVPHEMTHQDIQDVIDAFVNAAFDAKAIGADGIEIHAAHGYLIDQFFWELTNRRTDEYGGKTLKERTHFACQIVKAIRKSVGPDFPIDMRISQWKMGDYNYKMAKTPQELESFLSPLVDAGVDMFHCSTRRFWDHEFEGSDMNLAGWVKKLSGKPTITVGSIGLDADFVTTMTKATQVHSEMDKMELLLKRLDRGDFDLVAVGRALLADPNWFKKITNGDVQNIVPFTKQALETLE